MPKQLTKTEILKRLDKRNQLYPSVKLYPKTQPYINSKSPLKFKCEHDHTWIGDFDRTIHNGGGCPECKLTNDRLKKRTPWCDILQQFSDIHNTKYYYYKDSYVSKMQKMKMKCSVHGNFQMSPHDHISLKRGCVKCNNKSNIEQNFQQMLTTSNIIHNNFYDYSRVKYINSYTAVDIICPIHGIFSQRMGDHSRGHGCKRCSGRGISKKSLQWMTHIHNTTGNYIQHAGNVGEFQIPGTRFTADGYCKATNTIYEFHGDVYHGNPAIFNSAELCNPFNKSITAGELYDKTIDRENLIKSKGFNLVVMWEVEFDKMDIPDYDIDVNVIIRNVQHGIPIGDLNDVKLKLVDSEFKGYKHKHNFKCLMCGSPFNTTLTQRLQTFKKRGVVGCTSCNNQANVVKILTKLLDAESIDYELVDYVIKIDGIGFYVQSLTPNDRTYLVLLQDKFKKLGVDLKIIFVDEILNNSELIISKIKHLCKRSNVPRIHARQCVVREIDVKTKGVFLNKYHTQGNDKAAVYLGVFHSNDSELLAVMTFVTPRVGIGFNTRVGSWELSRFATNTNYRIPGIASKLLKYFQRNYEWSEIYSYADKRWSSGNVYTQLQFTETANNPPAYWYMVSGNRKHRWGFRKDTLKQNYINYDCNKTEYEMMLEQGIDRVWDCGTVRYSLFNNPR